MFDNDWEQLRAETYAYTQERNETIMKKWLNKIGHKDKTPIGYYICLTTRTVEIYSTRPGVLIGKAGVDADELTKILSEELGGEWKTKFIEVRGGFVTV